MPPRSATTAPRPSRTRRLAEIALALAAIELLHLLHTGPDGNFDDLELVFAGLLLAAWLVRHTLEALKPRQRVRTWHKPRGLDKLRATK